MDGPSRVALVAGATGLVGGHLLRLLAGDLRYARVVALVRRPLRLDAPGAHARVVDFGRPERLSVDERVDDAFCALGTTRAKAGSAEAFRAVDLGHVEAFARAAKEAGARRFLLVSAVGADPGSRLLYNRVKGEAEAAVRALGFEATHVFRPSLLMGKRVERRPAERAGMVVGRVLRPLLPARYRPVAASDVARAMVAAALAGVPGFHVHEPVVTGRTPPPA